MAVLAEIAFESRTLDMEDALATGRLEGLQPSTGALAIFDRYVSGELNLEQMGAAIDDYADKRYGPVCLSRDNRP
jgi:hypothetical protein